ncbi:MAG: sulfatase [Candidatus Hodarchaeota archaeon]
MDQKMNVLFIITDQQRADHLGCAGNSVIKTPNIDALASDGLRFTNFYCSNPMCMPNRATIFTGQYPSLHGVRSNGINLNPGIRTFTQTMQDAGYHTASIGKIHLNFYTPGYSRKFKSAETLLDWLYKPKEKRPSIPVPYFGLDEVEMTVGHGDAVGGHYLDWLEERFPRVIDDIKKRSPRFFEKVHFDTTLPAEHYQTTFVTERTIAFLERFHAGDYGEKPFFMHCSFPDPHHPVCPPSPYREMYRPEDIKLPPSFSESLEEHELIGPYLKDPVLSNLVLHKSTEEETRKFLAYTYGAISMIDNGIGQILKSLDKLGLSDNTMVIFTSDHGDLGGQFKLLLKGPAHYRGLLKVPMIWKVPGLTKPGAITHSLGSSVDIPLTILKHLEIKNKLLPPEMQGIDLNLVLEDPTCKVRDHVIIEEDEELPRFHIDVKIRLRTMITETHRITVYENFPNFGDIFDYKSDPLEINNLWNDENSREIKFNLVNKILQELMSLQSRFPEKQALT